MQFIKFIRFLLGYVCFSCSGGFGERFVNLCFANGIKLWNVKSVNGAVRACVTLSAYPRLGALADKAGMTLTEDERRGLPVIIKERANRWGLAAGTAAACMIIWLLTGSVWSICVSGNNRYSSAQILSVCESLGIKNGARISSIDTDAVQKAVTELCDGIIWCSVNLNGSRVFIEVRENRPAPDMYTSDTPANLVAPEDGELLSLEVYAGEAQVKPGGAVLKGQLLISGVMTSSDGSVRFVRADGKCKIRRSASLDNTLSAQSVTGIESVKERKSLSFFSVILPLGIEKASDDKSRTEEFISANGVTLPIGIITDRFVILSSSSPEPDENRLMLLGGYGYFTREKPLVGSSQIERRELNYSSKDGKYAITGKYVLIEQNMIQQTIVLDG